jgi:hypothetical protein
MSFSTVFPVFRIKLDQNIGVMGSADPDPESQQPKTVQKGERIKKILVFNKKYNDI